MLFVRTVVCQEVSQRGAPKSVFYNTVELVRLGKLRVFASDGRDGPESLRLRQVFYAWNLAKKETVCIISFLCCARSSSG